MSTPTSSTGCYLQRRGTGRVRARGSTRRPKTVGSWAVVICLAAAGWAQTAQETDSHPTSAPFEYVGGTAKVKARCRGRLGLTSSSMIFACPEDSITIPYDSILLMQYRADISRKVRSMKLDWRFKPWRTGGNRNRYFTVVYSTQGKKCAVVLAVSPANMRPYLAEIDLRIGRRVEVQDHENYR